MRNFVAGFILGGACSALITYVFARLAADRDWERHVSDLHRRYAGR